MKELSLNILDIAQNSIKAEAEHVEIMLDQRGDWLTIMIADDGKGMSPEFAAEAANPFTTTRTTRKVGLGIPLLLENAERTGGDVVIESEPGAGTLLTAAFDLRNIDCPPMGSMADTLLSLVVLNPETPDFVFEACAPHQEASFDTRMIRSALGDVPLNVPDVVAWMRDAINEEFNPILEV